MIRVTSLGTYPFIGLFRILAAYLKRALYVYKRALYFYIKKYSGHVPSEVTLFITMVA